MTVAATAGKGPARAASPGLTGHAGPLGQAGDDALHSVRVGAVALVLAAALLQVVFFADVPDNVPTTVLALGASLLGLLHALDSRRMRQLPVSALILLFFTITSTTGALLVKTAEWSAVADRLQQPVRTFTVLLVAQVALLAADHLYLRWLPLQALRGAVLRRVTGPLGLLRWPPDAAFWAMGALGCASVLMTGTDYESGASFGLASAGQKIAQAFGFLKFAPFLIPFRGALSGQGGRPGQRAAPLLPVVGYFLLLIGVSFATNSRSTFADAMPTIGICLLLARAAGRLDLRAVPPLRLATMLLLAGIAVVLLPRIALAMVVARDFRYDVNVGMLVRTTIEAVFNSEWLAVAKGKMDTAVSFGGYSEVYVDSRFFARFLLTKFHDNILVYLSLAGPDHLAHYRGFMLDRLLATMPDPLLRLLGIAIDKQDLVISNGDFVVYMIDGWGLGGFKTGSMIGEVFSVFGWAGPLVLMGAGLMLFVFYDAFALWRGAAGGLAVSPLILLLAWNLCGTTAAFGLGAETLTAIPSGIVRGLPQNVVIYALTLGAVQVATRLWRRPRR